MMNTIRLNFEHCFGIRKLSQELSFEEANTVLIYAPNGLMKTSFAKTLQLYGQEKYDKIKDVVENEPAKVDIKDSHGNPILPSSIYVSNCEESDPEASKNITLFLADSALKEQYDNILGNLYEKQKALFKAISEYAKSTDIVAEFVRVFCEGKRSLLYKKFEEVMADVTTEHKGEEYNFKYNSMFDKEGKIKAFIDANREDLKDYFNKYKAVLGSSKLFKQKNGKTFGIYEASELYKSVADNAFFAVKHKIVLAKKRVTIGSAKSFKNLIDNELSRALDDANVKKAFEKIDKKASANDSLRQFNEIIRARPGLVDKLLDYDDFRKKVWKWYFSKFYKEASALREAYKKAKPELEKVLEKAEKQATAWEKTISIFNRRFSVPFEAKITNQNDLLLNKEAAVLSYEYHTQTSAKEVKSEILEEIVLSKGERRAFYTLQLLFAIEKMKCDKEQEHILIFDDISDSFDYKNKYAIVEYLCDLKDDARFKIIILTHNFDFYRTISSRLQVNRNNTYMAYKASNDEIKFHKAEYLKDPFKFIMSKANTPEFFISLIPFVRNIIEYTKDTTKAPSESDYLKLTSCLHIKAETKNLSVDNVKEILHKNIDGLHLPTKDGNLNIKDYTYKIADNLCKKQTIDEIHIENKIVFALAIRLKAEDYMIYELQQVMSDEEFNSFYLDIKSNQTSVLTKKFYECCSPTNEIQLLIKEVNLITPANIHLNSFMFEPLIDMSVWRLKKLYQDTKTQLKQRTCNFHSGK